jgi:phage shock protein C
VNSLRTKFYKDKANGKFMGVCAGIADYTGIDILWARIGMLVLMWLSGGVVFMAYLALGILAENKPSGMYADRQEQKFWQGVRQSPSRTAREVRADFRDIDRRLAAVEAYYVSSNPRLSDEIEKLR